LVKTYNNVNEIIDSIFEKREALTDSVSNAPTSAHLDYVPEVHHISPTNTVHGLDGRYLKS
jgi:hypothetical protein